MAGQRGVGGLGQDLGECRKAQVGRQLGRISVMTGAQGALSVVQLPVTARISD